MAKAKHVLVVDDEMDICETIRDELMDYKVETAYSYEQARGKLEKGMYDCVVLDIMGVSGFELLEEFGTKFPIIILTGQKIAKEALDRAIKLNARLYLPKDQLWMIEEYVEKVLKTSGVLWGWLFKRVNFSKWFGKEWSADDAMAQAPEGGDEKKKPDAGVGGVKMRRGGPSVAKKPAAPPAKSKPAAGAGSDFDAWAEKKRKEPSRAEAVAPAAAPAAAKPAPAAAAAGAAAAAPDDDRTDEDLLADLLGDAPDLGAL